MYIHRSWLKFVAFAGAVTIFTSYLYLLRRSNDVPNITWTQHGDGFQGGGLDDPAPLTGNAGNNAPVKPVKPDSHPISKLIDDARLKFSQMLGKRSLTLDQAASRYRERRGRHPPPGFDVWFQEARNRNAIIIEDFFDRIHHDINPFWAMNPLTLRHYAHTQPQVIRVRNGKAHFETDDVDRPHFIQLWTELVQEMMPHLPDLDMVVDVMDENRLLVPWEKINSYVEKERKMRELFPTYEAVNVYTNYAEMDANPKPYEAPWIGDEASIYWDHYRITCPPDSPSRNISSLPTFNESIDGIYPMMPLPYTYKGFVQNFTAAQDPCQQPHLRGLHGTFVESMTISTLHDLFPMFAGSKMPQNNELLIPGGMYLTKDKFYHGGQDNSLPWEQKKNGLIWRGVASGGRNKADNWWHFQRHRFVQMMNGSVVSRVEAGDAAAGPTFRLVPNDVYNLPMQKNGKLGKWVSSVADAGFVFLECFPKEFDEKGTYLATCAHTTPFYDIANKVPMQEQYNYKYLPDVDGNSYSARWRGFLKSTTCPLKSTIYAEWHDDRLVPWVHFVPFDNTFMDIYAVMDYFLNGHDAMGERIAKESSQWASLVLRRDDMMLYVWRLLLEYARVVDPKRDRLGFVGDLVGSLSL